jgi:hypothetical protein
MKATCPRCQKEGELQPHPRKLGRLTLTCSCNTIGPVLERDADPVPAVPAKLEKEK